MEKRRLTVSEEKHGFDDHMNIATTQLPSTSAVRFGEPVGSQPNHGFTCFLDLRKEIKSMTVCLGSNPRVTGSSSIIVGLKVDYRHESFLPDLLGRCSVFGPTLELSELDYIVKVEIGLIEESDSKELQTINHIIFTTQQGMVKGFRNDMIIHSSISGDHQVVFSSCDRFELIGLNWVFDLRQSSATDHGIEPVYVLKQKPENPHNQKTNIQKVLYPSQPWMHSISTSIRPRPIPAKEGNEYPVVPLLFP